ncbi:MAG TPA: isopentenyl phosphate kinase [Conexivisphaerales archaeon]|nr:isopentenyl phosphate kinase [Conexivisphaerales archaeon]
MADTVVVKLGGSFITDKERLFTFREEQVKEAVKALRGTGRDFALVHGGGSFGHPVARRFKLSSKEFSKSSEGVSETRLAMHNLSYLVYIQLGVAGFKPFLLHSSSLLRMDGSPASTYPTMLSELVRTGLTPLTHGDVQLFFEGYRIVSGDHLALLFCKALKPSRMVFVVDQPGIMKRMGDPGSVVKEMTVAQARELKFEGSEDATGGVSAKVKSACEIATLGVETCFVSGFDRDGLIRAVTGEKFSGTLLRR